MNRSKHAVRHGLFGVMTAALVLAGSLPTLASGDSQEIDPSETLTHQEALSYDAQELAGSSPLSEEEMQERLEREGEIADSIEEIRDITGPRLSAVYVKPDEELAIHVLLTGSEEIAALSQLSSTLQVPVFVDYGATHSEEQLIEAANELSEQFFVEDVDGVDGVEVSGTAEGLVVVTNAEADSTTEEAIANITANVLEVAPSAKGRAQNTDIEVLIEENEGIADSTRRGGVALTSCTSGFTVVSGSKKGFVTAGHCPNSQKYSLTPTGKREHASTFRKENYGKTADIQWHQVTKHTVYKSFFGSSATKSTTQRGTKTAYVGQGLCHRGLTSGYSCGYVTSTKFAPKWKDACNKKGCSASFVRVSGSDLANRKGDSGGPWFSGGYAYGLNSGGLIADVGAWAAYTPVSKFSTVGVSLYK